MLQESKDGKINVPRVTILTVCYNSEKTIEETLCSVQSQTYANLEYIVIDGASTDRTLEILNDYQECIDIIVSEPDNGLYDALNKGIALSSGDIIAILHSDDCFYNDYVVERIMNVFARNPSTHSVMSNLEVGSTWKSFFRLRIMSPKKFRPRKLMLGIMPPHCSTFIKKSVYELYGNFNTRYRIAADFDLFLRFFLFHQVNYKIATFTSIRMKIGGISNQGLRSYVYVSYELLAILKSHSVGKFRYLILLRGLWKITGFLIKNKEN